MNQSGPTGRPDIRAAVERDALRRARREVGHGSFWRSLSVLGMVGWPIALSSAGGALLGHYLDRRWNTGVRFTLLLLMIGTGAGSYVAWKTLGRKGD